MAVLYNPQITISAAPGITGYLRLALFEASAPTVEVAASDQLAPPHVASRQLQFLDLDPVIHIARLYVTDGSNPTGTIIATFSIDPRFPGVELKAPMFIYAGTTPGFDVGDFQFTDPDDELVGWDYSVDIRGMGKLDPETEVDTTGPGYMILIPDYQLQDNELHIITFEPKLIVYSADTDSAASLFKAVEVVDADRALVAADAGKMFLVQSLTSTITITLPEIDSVAASKIFWFTSQGGSHKNAVIEVDGSDSEKIDYAFGENTQLVLGQSEQLMVYKWIDPDDSGNRRWKVAMASDGILKVGELFFHGKYDAGDLINALQCAGQLVDRDVYPRLWAYVQGLDASMLVSDATWSGSASEKGKFSTGDGSTTFRLPLLYETGFIKAVDGPTRKAGSLEAQSNENLYAQFDPNVSQDFYMNKTTVPSWNSNWYAQDTSGDSASAVVSARTTGLTVGSLGTGTIRPANIGAYLLIRI